METLDNVKFIRTIMSPSTFIDYMEGIMNDSIGLDKRLEYLFRYLGGWLGDEELFVDYDRVPLYEFAKRVEPLYDDMVSRFEDNEKFAQAIRGETREGSIYGLSEFLRDIKNPLKLIRDNGDIGDRDIVRRAMFSYVPEVFSIAVDKTHIPTTVDKRAAKKVPFKFKYAEKFIDAGISDYATLYDNDPIELVSIKGVRCSAILNAANALYKVDPQLDWLGKYGHGSFSDFAVSFMSPSWGRFVE